MRIRYLTLIIVSLMICTPGHSQLKFGLRGGVSKSNVKLNKFSNPDYTLEYKSSRAGFHFGGIMQLKMGMFVLQPELLFSNVKTDVKLNNISVDSSYAGEQSFNRIDIPVIAGLKLGPVKLQAGPVASIILSSKSDLLDKHGIEQAYKGMTIGYQAGLGFELGSLLLDVKYEGSLSNFGDGVTIAGEQFSFDQRLNQLILSIGFLF